MAKMHRLGHSGSNLKADELEADGTGQSKAIRTLVQHRGVDMLI